MAPCLLPHHGTSDLSPVCPTLGNLRVGAKKLEDAVDFAAARSS